jgi:hypothetical protein
MISVMAAILALVGRSREDIQSLTWSFIVATASLGFSKLEPEETSADFNSSGNDRSHSGAQRS